MSQTMTANVVAAAAAHPDARGDAAFCPYKGLQPYTDDERDRRYFFGRDRDREVIISNLYAAPLTVLHGASGVGKSSVLMAGVVPALRETPRVAAVVFREWQHAGFRDAVKLAAYAETARQLRGPVMAHWRGPLDEVLAACARALRGPLFFVFDQFEEYFLYHPASDSEDSFDAELARAVNRRDVKANFLFSMREDGLSKLDRFQGRIPNLLANLLRLEHLDRAAAEDAVRKPLEEYNRRLPAGDAPVGIEDALVATLLAEVQAGNVRLEPAEQGAEAGRDAAGIETPFLQMVLTRLWREEMSDGSRTLRLSTLRRLGGAESIVRTHLDDVMARFGEEERRVAAGIYRFLVTPSGMKIAHTLDDLAALAEQPPAAVKSALKQLSEPDVRILRPVTPPLGQSAAATRYEIFHDVLAAPIRDWRKRYADAAAEKRLAEERRAAEAELKEERDRAEQQAKLARRLRVLSLALVGVLVLAVGFAVYAMRQRAVANERAREAEEALARARAADERAAQSELDKETLKRLFLEYSQTTQGGPRLTEEQLENKIREGRRAAESGNTKAAAPRDLTGIGKLWAPGTTLRIRFLDGTPGQRETVEKYAREWTEYANIKFAFGDDPDAEIRVSFENDDSYSYVGTDALGAPKNEPTINLGFVKPKFPEREKRKSILHEFGHVLGLLHEFQNPSANIPWDREAVYKNLGETGWDRGAVDANLFEPWRSKDLPPKEFDPLSIMMFAFPAELRTDRVAMNDNDQLSEGDKAYIARLYPR